MPSRPTAASPGRCHYAGRLGAHAASPAPQHPHAPGGQVPLVEEKRLWYTSIGSPNRGNLHCGRKHSQGCPSCQVGRGQEERGLPMSKNELLSKALKAVQSRFLLVNLLTKRIRQLKDGASPLVERSNNVNAEQIALQEIAEGKIVPTNPVG